MSAESIAIEVGIQLARLAADALEGEVTPADAARRVVAAGLALVPIEELRQYLDEEARQRVEGIADAAEGLKFGDKT